MTAKTAGKAACIQDRSHLPKYACLPSDDNSLEHIISGFFIKFRTLKCFKVFKNAFRLINLQIQVFAIGFHSDLLSFIL